MHRKRKILALVLAFILMLIPVTTLAETDMEGAPKTEDVAKAALIGGLKSTEYSPELALTLMGLSNAAYDKSAITAQLSSMGIAGITAKEYYAAASDSAYGSDNVAYAMGNMKLADGRTLVVVVVRGSVGKITSGSSDWQSNFNVTISAKGNHTGFENAAAKLEAGLKNYVETQKIQKPVYILTGHSRGAAVANIVATELMNEGVEQSDVYGYTFACPDVTVNEAKIGNYSNIFNICNASDMVTVLARASESILDSRVESSQAVAVKAVLGEAKYLYPSLQKNLQSTTSMKWYKYGTTLWYTKGDFGATYHHPTYYIAHLQNLESLFHYELEGAPPKTASEGEEGPFPEVPNQNMEIVPPPQRLGNLIDVTTADYFYEAVKWAIEQKITTGTTSYSFSPDTACTRAQAVTFLWRAAGSPEPKKPAEAGIADTAKDGISNGTSGVETQTSDSLVAVSSKFSDVPQNAYYVKAVAWALENNITSGISETGFGPELVCTRGQIVTFLHRAAQVMNTAKGGVTDGVSVNTAGALSSTTAGSIGVNENNKFTDVAADAYYAQAVAWAVEKNVTSGTSESNFSPDSSCKRGQIVTFLYRSFK